MILSDDPCHFSCAYDLRCLCCFDSLHWPWHLMSRSFRSAAWTSTSPQKDRNDTRYTEPDAFDRNKQETNRYQADTNGICHGLASQSGHICIPIWIIYGHGTSWYGISKLSGSEAKGKGIVLDVGTKKIHLKLSNACFSGWVPEASEAHHGSMD